MRRDIDTRKFMEMAVEVMKQSIAEPREDGKASPKVGAVLMRPDGTVQAENQDFIAQALERAAAAAEEKTPEIVLSSLEGVPTATQIDDLSTEALEAYRSIANIEEALDSPSFRTWLARQGILKQEGHRFAPTGFGFLLFGKEPRTAFPQAGLLGTINYPNGTEEIANFEGPQILAPDQALQWLRDKLPNPIDRSEARRREANAPLFELVREGIVNALVHRDYDITGGKCQLTVTPDKIVVKSPGLPVLPITLEQLRSFSAPMLSRNPVLHYVFARMDLAEERGLGLQSMRRRAEAAGLPLPRYTFNNPYLELR